MLKKIAVIIILNTCMSVQAEQKISYDYLETGYKYIDFKNNENSGLYFMGAFSINKSLYVGGYYEYLDLDSLDSDKYGLFLGFHKKMSERTDFYSEFNAGRGNLSSNYTRTIMINEEPIIINGTRRQDSTTFGLDFGTRTAFTEKFELISRLGYTHNESFNNGFFKAGVKGLFKLTNHSSIATGIENVDGDHFGASIGYRYSF